jgi:hypothetical protein
MVLQLVVSGLIDMKTKAQGNHRQCKKVFHTSVHLGAVNQILYCYIMLEILEGIQSGSALVNKNLLNIGEGSKKINVIVKELVLVKIHVSHMDVFLIHIRNFYPKHFDSVKMYNSLYKFHA